MKNKMVITKLELKNFRSFEHETIELDDITVFVGENNTGKSSIMDAIKFVVGTPVWNEGLSRYDFLLNSPESNPGAAGEILIKAEMSEETEDEWLDEIQQTLPDSIDIDEEGLRHFYVALKGTYDQFLSKPAQTREFQNKNGESKGSKANSNQAFNHLKSFLPVFQINSIRDFEAEFQQKRGLFRKFLNSDKIEPEKKIVIEEELTELNKKIISVLQNIKLLKDNLTKSMTILSGTGESIIDIESVPTNLDTLIEKAGIILQNATGIKLPLERQGSGALSLAVIFLYEAYLSVLIAEEFDKFATPILLIEEPEAHLHPSAVRLFWYFLEKMPGQKIVSTHSGDIIIQYAQIDISIFLKVAEQLFIPWFIITDGDAQGQANRKKALSFIGTSNHDDFVFSFSNSAIEVYLMCNGFQDFYLSKINTQIAQNITKKPDDLGCFEAVYSAIKDARSISKPEIVMEIVDSIISGKQSSPPIIEFIKEKLGG